MAGRSDCHLQCCKGDETTADINSGRVCCNSSGCAFRLCVIGLECSCLVSVIDADAGIHLECCVSCFSFIFKYI